MIADHGAIQQQANSMADKIEKLQDTLDELKTDVTQRRSRPAPEQMTWCSDTLQEIQDEMRALVATLQTNKATWKRAWEKQLQLIIQEQHAVEEWEHMVVDAEEDVQTMHTIMDHLQQVVTLYQQSGARPSNSSSTSRAYLFSSSPIVSSTPITTSFMNSQRDAMTDVLHQLRTIDVDHDRRVQAVVKSEQRRSKFMAHHIDDFEKELITFQLKNTGGAQQLEQQQEQKTKQLLQDLYNAQKAPPSPSVT
ncbi:actin interacting protein 3 [Gongronella butleri]|nr:actin interacting protein 3 [Gongronella butleri]